MPKQARRKATVKLHNVETGTLEEWELSRHYRFVYNHDYEGPPISLTMPVQESPFEYNEFPPFFEGLLPEGGMLEALLRQQKINMHDYYSQLLSVGTDLVGAVTVEKCA